MEKKTVAILTPTYNRAHLLPRLYESLSAQTDKGFTWYIVDDGSTDNTEQICKTFVLDGADIVYIKKENGGKHTAINTAMETICEPLTFIVDSDDYLSADAVETIISDYERCQGNQNIAGMSYYRAHFDGVIIGDAFLSDYFESNYITYIINQQIKGDKAEVFKTEILKQIPFPVHGNERFCSEAVVWMEIAKRYDFLYRTKAIYFCEYLSDGLTKQGGRRVVENPRAYIDHANAMMSEGVRFWIRCKYMIMYVASSKIAGKQKESYKKVREKWMYHLFSPLGILYYYYLNKKWGIKRV